MICAKMFRKYRTAILSLIAITAGVGLSQNSITGTNEQQKAIHQLRIYEIFDGNKKAFHDRFRDHAMRIMARYDFKIIATWETKKGDRTEFVYLLEWPDKETMRGRWAKFMADQEWSDIKKETDYSPRKTLAK
jgi:NIPSNAP